MKANNYELSRQRIEDRIIWWIDREIQMEQVQADRELRATIFEMIIHKAACLNRAIPLSRLLAIEDQRITN